MYGRHIRLVKIDRAVKKIKGQILHHLSDNF